MDSEGGGGAGTFFLVVFILGLIGAIGWYMMKGFKFIRGGETGLDFIQSLRKPVEPEDYDQLDKTEALVEKREAKKNSAQAALEQIQTF